MDGLRVIDALTCVIWAIGGWLIGTLLSKLYMLYLMRRWKRRNDRLIHRRRQGLAITRDEVKKS